jgi:hypothetical protein
VTNVRALSSQERAFLDRLVEAEKRVGRRSLLKAPIPAADG